MHMWDVRVCISNKFCNTIILIRDLQMTIKNLLDEHKITQHGNCNLLNDSAGLKMPANNSNILIFVLYLVNEAKKHIPQLLFYFSKTT
jgi:hypothetical protein